MKPFTGDLAQTGTLQQAVEVRACRVRYHFGATPIPGPRRAQMQPGPLLDSRHKAARRIVVLMALHTT